MVDCFGSQSIQLIQNVSTLSLPFKNTKKKSPSPFIFFLSHEILILCPIPPPHLNKWYKLSGRRSGMPSKYRNSFNMSNTILLVFCRLLLFYLGEIEFLHDHWFYTQLIHCRNKNLAMDVIALFGLNFMTRSRRYS